MDVRRAEFSLCVTPVRGFFPGRVSLSESAVSLSVTVCECECGILRLLCYCGVYGVHTFCSSVYNVRACELFFCFISEYSSRVGYVAVVVFMRLTGYRYNCTCMMHCILWHGRIWYLSSKMQALTRSPVHFSRQFTIHHFFLCDGLIFFNQESLFCCNCLWQKMSEIMSNLSKF